MDLALVRRLASSQLSMDTSTALTRGMNPLEAALLTVVPLADMGFPTLILRDNEQGYIGQIRHRAGETHAHMASLAPVPDEALSYLPWMQLVNGMIATAGKRGAMTLTAEVPESAYAVFEILRKSGFSVYARQMVFQRLPAKITPAPAPRRVMVRPVVARDLAQLSSLYANLVPGLVQHADPPQFFDTGRNGTVSLVVEALTEGRVLGYLPVIEGKSGLVVKPLLHPDVFDETEAVFGEALHLWQKAERLPLYVCVRSYQEWIGSPLQRLGFSLYEQQLLFVKYTVARVEKSTERLPVAVETLLGSLVGQLE